MDLNLGMGSSYDPIPNVTNPQYRFNKTKKYTALFLPSLAPPSVCVPDVIGALAVRIQNQKENSSQI